MSSLTGVPLVVGRKCQRRRCFRSSGATPVGMSRQVFSRRSRRQDHSPPRKQAQYSNYRQTIRRGGWPRATGREQSYSSSSMM